jgi:hypothetical protein
LLQVKQASAAISAHPHAQALAGLLLQYAQTHRFAPSVHTNFPEHFNLQLKAQNP